MSDSHQNIRVRLLQSIEEESRGRTVLTILYLIVLGLCFIVPIFYYFRMHCEDRRARRLRELEFSAIEASINEHRASQGREETRAARRKYREEKRARILQLFEPVRLVSSVLFIEILLNSDRRHLTQFHYYHFKRN